MWVAACIDLTLAVQGESVADVRRKLHEQIALYVLEAVTVDAEHAEHLLGRMAPLRDRLRFAFWLMVSRRPKLRHSAGVFVRRAGLALRRKLAYMEPLPLVPA